MLRPRDMNDLGISARDPGPLRRLVHFIIGRSVTFTNQADEDRLIGWLHARVVTPVGLLPAFVSYRPFSLRLR